ncbi:MAG TPA: hypothetical protein VJS13_17100 [Pyrinomonadaceae bacterium]|nr:hypothetical protein [Pyrinomonadaceae bacterium]
MTKPYSFGESEFYDYLYVKRDVEEVLKKDIRMSGEYLLLVGPRGSGKTTVGKKIQREMKNSAALRIFIVFLDIRFIKQNLNLNRDSFVESLKRQVMVRYLEDLFPLDHDEKVFERLRLWEYLLQPGQRNRLPSALSATIHELRDEANLQLQRFRFKSSENERADLYAWLKATHLNKGVSALTKQLEKTIGIAHLIYAAQDLCNYDRQIIWFDNTDALPEPLQPEVIDLVKTFHQGMGNRVSTVVAIREENVYRDEDPFEEPGAPPYRKRIKMRIDRDNDGNPLWGIDIPIIEPNELESIVEQRMDLAKRKQKQYRDEYNARIDSEMSIAQEISDLSQKEESLRRIEEYKKHLTDYEPLMSESVYRDFKKLSAQVMNVLHDNMLIYLTNSSLREFLFIHRDVLSHVIKSAKYDLKEALGYPAWYISTLFYQWLASTDRDYQIPAYNVVKETENWIHNGKKRAGCILSYLIITTIWNLTLEKEYEHDHRRAFHNPYISEVENRLKELDYTEDEIINKLYELHTDVAPGSIVEFRSHRRITSADDLKWNKTANKVYLTYRGRCLASLSSNTFGFFYQNIQQYLHPHGGGDALQLRRASEYAEQMLPYLCDIAQMHYDSLKILRANSGLEPEVWFTKYCERYGIPQRDPYRRSIDIGVQIKGIRRALQFEALVAGLISYSAGGQISFGTTVKDKMQHLQNNFAKCVESLRREGTPIAVDFRSEVGLSQR